MGVVVAGVAGVAGAAPGRAGGSEMGSGRAGADESAGGDEGAAVGDAPDEKAGGGMPLGAVSEATRGTKRVGTIGALGVVDDELAATVALALRKRQEVTLEGAAARAVAKRRAKARLYQERYRARQRAKVQKKRTPDFAKKLKRWWRQKTKAAPQPRTQKVKVRPSESRLSDGPTAPEMSTGRAPRGFNARHYGNFWEQEETELLLASLQRAGNDATISRGPGRTAAPCRATLPAPLPHPAPPAPQPTRRLHLQPAPPAPPTRARAPPRAPVRAPLAALTLGQLRVLQPRV